MTILGSECSPLLLWQSKDDSSAHRNYRRNCSPPGETIVLHLRNRPFWGLGGPGFDFHWFSIKFLLESDHFGALAGRNLVRLYKALLGSVAVAVLILFRYLSNGGGSRKL